KCPTKLNETKRNAAKLNRSEEGAAHTPAHWSNMIKFRYKRKEPTNVVPSPSPLASASAAPSQSQAAGLPAPPSAIIAAPLQHQHPHQQLNQLISNSGTLPRSSPRKLMMMESGVEGGGHKAATLTRQSKQKASVSALAKVASSVELAVLGYNNNHGHSHSHSHGHGHGGGIGNGTAERDRCINAVI
ncbi:Hypothetical predicted protein, partial [Drosophila guanche]